MPVFGNVFVSVYDPGNLNTPKNVTDNGRNVYYLNCLSAQGREELNGEGDGSAIFDIRDRDVYPLIEKGDHIHIYQHSSIAGGDLTIARFIAKRIKPVADESGGTHLIEGPGIPRELQERTVKQTVIDDGAGGKADDALEQALQYATYGWTTNEELPEGGYLAIQKQSVWDAIVQLCGQAGINFRYSHPRQIELVNPIETDLMLLQGSPTSQGIAEGAQAKDIGIILKVSRDLDHNEFYTRGYIEGAKSGDEVLGISDMDYSGITIPAGFTMYWASNLIVNTAAETASQSIIEAYLEYPEIKPADDSAEAKQSAQEQLLAAALNDMSAAAANEYTFVVEAITHQNVKPGDKVFVLYTEQVGSEVTFSINGFYYVYSVTYRVNQGQDERVTILEMGVSERPPAESDGSTAIAKTLKAIKTKVDNATGSYPAGATGPAQDHGALAGLEDDDHQQYLLASGTRQLAGNLAAASGVTIDGVDLDVHAANPAAHHPVVTTVSNQLPILNVETGLQRINFTLNAGDGLEIDWNTVQMKTPQSSGSWTPNTADESGHTHFIITTQDGQASPGVILRSSDHGGLRLHSLGIGMPPPVSTQPGQLNITGDIVFSGEQTISSDAGSQLWIGPGQNLRLNPGAKNILSGTAVDLQPSGTINAFADLNFQGQRVIRTTADQLRIEPASDLFLRPGAKVLMMNDRTLELDGFTAGFLGNGWRIDGDGNAEFRKIYADEMRVTLFTAEVAVANGRALYVTPGASKLTQDFTCPANIEETTTLWVEDIPGAPGFAVFEDQSWVMIRYFKWETPAEGGHLELFNIWGQVDQYNNVSQSSKQSYRFTLKSADSYARGQKIEVGAPVLGFGKAGSGWVSISAGDAASDPNTPNIAIRTWGNNGITPDVPYDEDNRQLHAMLGNLYAVTSQTGEYGLFAGNGSATADSYLIFSNTRASIYNTLFRIYDNGQMVFAIDPGVPSLALGGGTGIPTAPQAGGDGLWAGLHDGKYMARIGGTPGTNKPALIWNGNALSLRNSSGTPVIVLEDDGDSRFEGAMIIGPAGSINAGATSLTEDGLTMIGNAGAITNPEGVYSNNPDTAIKFELYDTRAVIYGEGLFSGNQMNWSHIRKSSSSTSPYNIISVIETKGAGTAAIRFEQFVVNNQPTATYATFLVNGAEVMRLSPKTVHANQIRMASTGGTTDTYVPRPPSGSITFFEVANSLYLKNSSGNVYRINMTAI